MRELILPRQGYARSRRWYFWANRVAASSLIRSQTRIRVYRALGLSLATDMLVMGARCYIHSSELTVGALSYINDACFIENVAPVHIGRSVGVAPQVSIFTSAHEIGPAHQRFGQWDPQPVVIEDGCWIGARAVVLPGVTVGRGSIVAAGAVVTSDLEPNGLYGGVPARLIRRLDQPETTAALGIVEESA